MPCPHSARLLLQVHPDCAEVPVKNQNKEHIDSRWQVYVWPDRWYSALSASVTVHVRECLTDWGLGGHRGRAPNLFTRGSARTTLQAFATVKLEQDAVFAHLSRVARGRSAMPANPEQELSASEELFTPKKRGLF